MPYALGLAAIFFFILAVINDKSWFRGSISSEYRPFRIVRPLFVFCGILFLTGAVLYALKA